MHATAQTGMQVGPTLTHLAVVPTSGHCWLDLHWCLGGDPWSSMTGWSWMKLYTQWRPVPHGWAIRAPSQYPKRHLFVRSRKVSKPRDWYFKLSYRFEIWQAHRQHCCRSACPISERSDNSKYKSRGFETWRDLTERRLSGYWDGAQVSLCVFTVHSTIQWLSARKTWLQCISNGVTSFLH